MTKTRVELRGATMVLLGELVDTLDNARLEPVIAAIDAEIQAVDRSAREHVPVVCKPLTTEEIDGFIAARSQDPAVKLAEAEEWLRFDEGCGEECDCCEHAKIIAAELARLRERIATLESSKGSS